MHIAIVVLAVIIVIAVAVYLTKRVPAAVETDVATVDAETAVADAAKEVEKL